MLDKMEILFRIFILQSKKGETVFSTMHQFTFEEHKPFQRDVIPRYGMSIIYYEVHI